MSRFRNLTTALAAALLVAAPSLHAVELQSVAGTDTKLNVYGFVWAYANYYIDADDNRYTGTNTGRGATEYAGSLFYAAPGATGTTNFSGYPKGEFQINEYPTRFGFASTTPSANLGDVKTKIEYDLNGSNDHLRLAQIQFGGWTIGQAWSMWVDLDAGPDTVDWAGAIGTPGFDTCRYPAIQYVAQLDKNNSLGISLEQNGGEGDGSYSVSGNTSTGSRKIPTIIGMYTYADSWGHIGLRVMGQNYSAFIPATATTGSQDYNKMEAAGMVSGDIKIAKDDLVFNFYDGKALGNYGVGFQAALFNDKTQEITGLENLGWMVGYTHNWTDAVRSNIVLSGVTFKSDSSTPQTAAGTDGTTGALMKTGYFAAINTFVMLTKNLQFGAEYVWEQAKAFGSNDVWIDYDGSAKNKIVNNKIELALKANF
jgi:hypothetical protein